ncbi:MAG TPA: DUF4129 domain-containing protein [Candidatus Limnocylindrales bacterium]|jgi:MFS family permease|nr:DUF4129 domain-containing protein [Candidatus Limnocylindrales bacterium]
MTGIDSAGGSRSGRKHLRPSLAPGYLVPLALAIFAESAWIAIAAGLVQEFVLHEPRLGIAAMAPFVIGGVVASRLLAVRLGSRWPLLALGLCAAGGLIGWLLAPEARAALASNDLGGAIGAHPGGWVAGIAVLRGFAHGRFPLSESTLANLIGFGIPGVAIAAIVGGMVAEPWRSLFLADALVAAIAFGAAATLALALVRLSEVGADSGFDWRQNPSWVALLVVLIAGAAALAVPASAAVAPIVAFVLGAAAVPIIIVGGIIGFDLRAARILGTFVAVAIIIGALASILGLRPEPPGSGGSGVTPSGLPTDSSELVIGAYLVVLLAIVGILVLARLWMRRLTVTEDRVPEQRMIDHGERSAPRRRIGLRRRVTPTDAVAAYVQLVDDLADRPAFRREPAETPAEHARRLRVAGQSGLSLDLLAADYALARFGGVVLSSVEDRRAVGRWRQLRRRLVEPQRGPDAIDRVR